MTRTIALTVAVLALTLGVPSGHSAPDIDRTAVDFKTPGRDQVGEERRRHERVRPCSSGTRASRAPTSCA